MRKNKLVIRINKPASEVFEFTLNPQNTSRWIDSIVKEETNELPVKKGSTYRNKSKKGKWSEYTVKKIVENEIFELISKDGNYHVRYTYTPIDEGTSELEYYEWVDKGELEEPFNLEILQKLKRIIED